MLDVTETLQFSKGNPYLIKVSAGISDKVTGGSGNCREQRLGL